MTCKVLRKKCKSEIKEWEQRSDWTRFEGEYWGISTTLRWCLVVRIEGGADGYRKGVDAEMESIIDSISLFGWPL